MNCRFRLVFGDGSLDEWKELVPLALIRQIHLLWGHVVLDVGNPHEVFR